MEKIDEASLNRTDRLGLAYCRLLQFEWDEILGDKPEGFDAMPKFRIGNIRLHKGRKYKNDYTGPALAAIQSIIGEANCSRCWWLFALHRTEEEWFQWYISERFKEPYGEVGRASRLIPK